MKNGGPHGLPSFHCQEPVPDYLEPLPAPPPPLTPVPDGLPYTGLPGDVVLVGLELEPELVPDEEPELIPEDEPEPDMPERIVSHAVRASAHTKGIVHLIM